MPSLTTKSRATILRWCPVVCLGALYSVALSHAADVPSAKTAPQPTQETPKPEEFPVTMAAQASKPDAEGRQRIKVTLAIRKPYHTLANTVGVEDLELGRVLMEVMGKSKLRDVTITYPKGDLVKDDAVGDYRIYQGEVTLEATVTREKGDTEPLTVTVRVRPFDEKGCRWLARTLSKEVP